MSSQTFGLGIVIGGSVSSSLKSSISTSIKSVGGLSDKLKELRQQRIKLKTVGTDDSKRKIKALNREMLDLKRHAVISFKFNTHKKQLMAQRNAILGIIGTGFAIKKPLDVSLDVEQAKGEMASLGIGADGINKIADAGKRFSNQFAGTTTSNFIRASYDIKSGIASLTDEGVADFTRLSALTATATKSTTAQMTKLFALGYGIYRNQFSSDFDFGTKFSAAISASVQAFRTDGSDLSSGLSTLGAVATKFGVSLSEQLSILGNAKGSFDSASEAATSYRAFLMNVGNAQDKLGIQMTDAEGRMLPMSDILQSLKEHFGDLEKVENLNALKSAFGSDEAVKIITALVDKSNDLIASQKTINSEMQKGTGITEQMANAMQQGKGFTLLSQQIGNLGATVGKLFMPAALGLASVIGSLAIGIDGLITEFPVLSSVVGGVLFGLFTLVTVLKVVAITKILVSMASLTLRSSFLGQLAASNLLRMSYNRLSIGAKVSAASQWLLNTAMAANPVGLLVVGIAALAAGAVYLYKNFEPFTNFIDGAWNKLKNFFSFIKTGWDGVGSIVSKIGSFFGFGENKQATVMSHVAMPQQQKLTPQQMAPGQKTPHQIKQNNNVNVTVNNPSSNTDVQRAVVQAMSKQTSPATSLKDEDI